MFWPEPELWSTRIWTWLGFGFGPILGRDLTSPVAVRKLAAGSLFGENDHPEI